ncbi:MAG: formate dehydrogenase, partial [Gammaproteobacteria bacterium]|nr:formate dehydrogenase [Gammaproteobacteria bacterium]
CRGADMILDDPDPIRAMVVISGNPLISVGQSARLQSAFKALDFVVLVDIYPNATSEVADYILPATDMFERSDINLAGLGLQHDPFVQYTAPIVSPRDERRPEWQIMGMLERALAGEPFQEITEDPLARMRHMLRRSDIDLDDLEEDVMPVRVLPRRPTGEFFERTIQTDDQLVDCFPDTMADSRARMGMLFEALSNEPPSQLKMISRRTNYMLNSWFHNVASLKRPSQQSNPLFIHPDDAESRQIRDGDRVRIHNEYGELEVEVAFDDQLRPGVVAMTHGWGQRGSLSIASKHPGVNANVLLPGGLGSYDPFSNQAFMTGIPVAVSQV